MYSLIHSLICLFLFFYFFTSLFTFCLFQLSLFNSLRSLFFMIIFKLFSAEFQIALEKVLNNSESYWVDLKGIFDRNFKNLKTLPPSSLKLVQTPIPDNHVLVKRLVCTPTRVICLSPTPVASSRLLRNYGNAFEFVIVCFREEQFQQLQGRETLSRIRDFIENGITVTRHYWFFCASASQLRDHKAYFVAASSYSEV